MTRLSVNINKVATLRNARGGTLPDVERFALDCERFGAQGITVHPRPDERHIRKDDVLCLKRVLTTEFNIEGNPEPAFMDLVGRVCPTQVTLVPDAHDQLTSNHGWNTVENQDFLHTTISRLHTQGIRVSVFVDAVPEMIEYAAKAGADRVELYTGPYAEMFLHNQEAALAMYRPAAEKARALGIGLNAGHDLNLYNLKPLVEAFPWIDEVSIGHALIADALYLGIEETIRQYRHCLVG
ncbi:MAG: pyridoxine 5'-phosphate synthase [Paludibacter sp.]|nr:pyridoxine 5'-phosphate synthase [Bacteroidales bacterium]MCM1069871.1 pyridoxine 5'-phosphate synthase [Prevotella sp.]MCM1353056.1 pyridoxine 5'-phosphate synthase [Bacteroides sp.]MCM1443413.1 pyridoxine 5'-phosphate synthase [Muribaculum sp.]MCM1481221.1 pyridoxine 5'-phosphate synthase [Paludibacter sp.]